MAIKTLAGNSYTHQEIFGQPKLWQDVFSHLLHSQTKIHSFLRPILQIEGLRIILTGAGSSAFIGESAAGTVQRQTNRITQAIATTDLVTNSKDFVLRDTPTLLVSFARSGNSPESVGALMEFDKLCPETYHLIITCNKEGALAKFGNNNSARTHSIILPEQTNDQSLAMTGSFTSMLLTALLVFDLESSLESYENDIEELSDVARDLLLQAEKIKSIAEMDFDRAIFLGSGPLLGIARECHLKLQELTDGQVICKHDSFLGFRHGPRVVANESSLVVYLVSACDTVKKYENDLIKSISEDDRNIMSVCVGCEDDGNAHQGVFTLNHPTSVKNRLLTVSYTLIGQLMGYYKSKQLGLNPDNPSVNGAISRVVQGVKLY